MKRNLPTKIKHFSQSLLVGVVAACILLGWSACTKRSTAFVPDYIESPTKYALYDIHFTSADTGFIVGGSKFTDGLVLSTYDGGLTWKLIDKVSPWILNGITGNSKHQIVAVGHTGKIANGFTYDSTFNFFQTFGWEELKAVQLLNDTLGVAVGGDSFGEGVIQRTTPQDKGVWHPIKVPHLLVDVEMIDAATGYACGFGAVYKTIDGAKTWKITAAKGDFFKGLSFVTQDMGYVVGSEGTILKTINGGKTWTSLRNGNSLFNKDWHFNDVLFLDANVGFIGGANGVLLRTTNGGVTWELSDYFDGNAVNKLYLSPTHDVWLVSDFGGIYKIKLGS